MVAGTSLRHAVICVGVIRQLGLSTSCAAYTKAIGGFL